MILLDQTSLFNEDVVVAVPDIAGLQYIPNFIEGDVEAVLIQAIDAQPWVTELKRRVQHYGYKYNYKTRGVAEKSKLGELPDWISPICEALHKEGYFKQSPDQVIINEYQPGQGIASHIDCVPCFGDTIASLSLGSACVMDLTDPSTLKRSSILLEPRSLIVLSGDARYLWRHGIAHRKNDPYQDQIIRRTRRLSLTFRNVLFNDN